MEFRNSLIFVEVEVDNNILSILEKPGNIGYSSFTTSLSERPFIACFVKWYNEHNDALIFFLSWLFNNNTTEQRIIYIIIKLIEVK